MKIFIKHTASKFSLLLFLISADILAQQKDTTAEKKSMQNFYNLAELRDHLDDSFNDQNFSNAVWGVLVKSLKTGEIIYKRNADKLFIPASNMKLFTSTAALNLLGPNYVFTTELSANGIIKNGKLEGDLIIQGTGDPAISNRFNEGSPTKIFETWADTLLSKGIREINGNIYGDDSAFDNTGLGKGWEWDNESFWFSAPSSALSFNDNTVELNISPAERNFPAQINIVPETKYISVISKVITVGDNEEQTITVSRLRGTNLISVTGKIRKSSQPVKEFVSISDPTMFFLTVLKEVFERKGIVVKGLIGSIDTADKIIISENLSHLLTHESVPLFMILKELNKNSNNFYAEQILKTIGYEVYGFGTAENGVRACKDLFNTMGINPDNMVMADGSGLSRLNLITPRQIVNLLSYMYKSDQFNPFYDSLPIGGVDGTLANRMRRTAAQNNVRAKAGYSNNVSALSGYIKTVNGEILVFSIMVNNFLAPPALANYLEDNVCNRLANFVRN